MKKTISILMSVLIICMSLFVPTAMAETNDTDNPELLYDGSFEATNIGYLSHAKEYDSVTYENAHIWYKPSHNSEIVEDGNNKALNLNRYAYQSVKIAKNTSYILTFKAKNASADLNVAVSLRNLKNRGEILAIQYSQTVKAGEDWTEYSVVLNVNDLLSGVTDYTLGLDAGANNSVLIDDISLKAILKYNVTVTATEGGTATVSKGVVEEGEEVTFTAEPSMKYKFDGWYYEDTTEPVSTDLVYTLAVTSDLTLVAKFSYNPELLYDGSFDETKTGNISYAKAAEDVTYENAHIWYKPSSNTTIIEDGTNKVLNLERFVYQSVDIFENTSYILKFKAKNASSDFNILASLRNLRDRNAILVSKNIAVTTSEEWVEYSAVIKVGAFLDGVIDYTLGLDSGANNSVLIDDISLKAIPKYNVTVTATEGGTATVSDNVVKTGETVTFTAEPMEGYEFVGWFYKNETEAVSTSNVYEVVVNSDITLIAKFKYVGILLLYDGSFEATNIGYLSHAKEYDGVTYENAHIWYKPSHNSEIVEDGNNKALNLNRYAYQSVKIAKNTSYILTFKAKNASADLNVAVSLRNLKNRGEILAIQYSQTVKAGEDWTEYSVVLNVNDLLSGVTDYTLGLDAGANNSVIIDDITLKNGLSTAYNNAAALRTANASSTGKNGLRIYNEVKKDWIKKAKIVEFGSIAAVTDKLNGAELNCQANVIKGVAYKQNVQDMILWEATDTSYIYTSYLSYISEKNYNRDIAIRTYAVDANGNYYYGEIVVVSVFKVANSIDNGFSLSGKEPSEIDQAAFYAFITGGTKDEYAQWCEANGLEIGNLYTNQYID